MKPDLKTELRELAGSIKPRTEFLQWGQEHLRIQARARRQTTKGPFEPTYTPRKQPSTFFPYRTLAFGTVAVVLCTVVSQMPSLQHALHQSDNHFFSETGAFLERHSLSVPFLNATTLDIHQKNSTSTTATSSRVNRTKESKEFNESRATHTTDSVVADTATSNLPAAAAAGVRPSVIETLKKVITLPSLPTLPDAVNENNGKKPEKELPEQATKPSEGELPEQANEQLLQKKPVKE